MAWMSTVLYIAVTVQLIKLCTATYSYTDASTLENNLTNGYHTMVRPSDTTNVTIEFGMYHITSLNNVDQTLSLVGFLLVHWNDDRLNWSPATYGGMTGTYLRDDQIWVPPLTLANSADDIEILSDDSDTKSIPLYIGFNGDVYWLAAANYLVACTVDITYYPFDKQKCEIQVSTWLYGASEVAIQKSDAPVNFELYEENGEWDVLKTATETGTRQMHGHAMSQVKFTLYLERKNSYYILNVILPVVFISFLGCLVFVLPVESGEKNGFSLTILLSLTVVLTIVSDKIPTTSINLCILSVYLICTVMISALEVLMTVIMQRIHVKTEHGLKLSGHMTTLTNILAKLACYRVNSPGGTTHNDSKESSTVSKGSVKQNKVVPKPKQPGSELLVLTTPVIYLYEYKDLANILDKIFFVLFFLITSIVTTTFLVVLSVGE